LPFDYLTQKGYIAEWCHKDDSEKVLPLVASGRYDAVITPRIVWPIEGVGDKWIAANHKFGLAWLYEIDDDAFSPGIIERQTRLFASEAAKGVTQLEWERNERIRLVSMSDGVIVSTQRLATVVRNHIAEDVPVYVVPNAIDAQWFRRTLQECGRVPELDGKLTIGWAGGTREMLDLVPVAQAWSVIAERYPEVHFVVQGYIPDNLANCVPKHRRTTLPWLELHEYPRAMLNFDIGCCAVAPIVFNTSKSAIKWYEMTLAGATCVVSPTVYGKEVTNGYDGLIADTPEQWVTALSQLIESAELRRTLLRNARKTVMTDHSLEANYWRWPQAWSDAIERFRTKPRLVLATA
jgi:glycosyltransferase involved in cell wall biosynthesis